MKTIGSYMAIFGLISSGLSFADMNLSLLMWIDMWGPGAGWAIRIGLIVVGGALWFLGNSSEE